MAKTASVDDIGEVPFAEEAITDLASVAELIKQGYGVFMDSDLEDAMSAHTPDHDQIVRFRRSGNGLHCHDTHNRDVVMMNGQCENGLPCTERQIEKAKEAQDLHDVM